MPLAHVFARFIEVLCIPAGAVLGHSPDTATLIEDLGTFRPTFILAVPRVFEKVYNSAEQKAAAGGKGAIFQRAAKTSIVYSRALDDAARARARGCASSTRSPTCSCCSKLRARAGRAGAAGPSPAAPPSASGSATSTAVSA